MEGFRIKARQALNDVRFTGRLGDIQVIDTWHEDIFAIAAPKIAPAIASNQSNLTYHPGSKPGYLTRAISRDALLQRIRSPIPSSSPDCLLVYISLSHGLALDIDRDLFLEIFDAMDLDPLMLRFLGKWDPGSCQPSTTGKNSKSYYVNYMRMRGHCLMWAYDKQKRNVRGIIMPKSFNPNVHTTFNPDFRFLNALVDNLRTHKDLIPEDHGFAFISSISIIERVSAALSEAYAAIAIVEQSTGHSTWNEKRSMNIDEMTQGSRDLGRAKHALIITKRHTDCVKIAYDMVVEAARGEGVEGPVLEPFRFLKNDVEALDLETESLMERANNQMAVLFNLIAREEARASIKLADASLKIAEAAKVDSGAMKTVAVMTMLFLPATFFAALFSMPLLRWGEVPVIQDRFWVYWAFSAPCTAVIMIFWSVVTYWKNLSDWGRLMKDTVRQKRMSRTSSDLSNLEVAGKRE